MSYPALSWGVTMALADLRALASRAPPEVVTGVTRHPLPAGNRVEAQKNSENRQFQGTVPAVTGVTSNFDDVGADERAALATEGVDFRTEGERWLTAYRRDAVAWMLEAMGEATRDGATEEPEGPLWPDPGTPERERLDRKNAAIAAGLLIGWERHRVKRQPG